MIAPAESSCASPAVDEPLRGGRIRALALGMAWFPEEPGGMDRYFFDLQKHLPSSGVIARGLVCGSAAAEQQSRGIVRAACASSASMPRRFLALRQQATQIISQFNPDLVAAHFALYARPVLGALKDKPLVMHFHGPWHAECRMEGGGRISCWAKCQLEKTVYRRADHLITLSDVFKRLLVEDFGVEPSRVSVIPGGVDLQRFDRSMTRSETRGQLGWPQDRPIVLAVRRLKKRMGLENLIEAAVAVGQKHPDVLILIAGSGELSAELDEKIKSLHLQNQVRLLGFLPEADLPLAYRAADLSVVPSIALEGFGLVAVESLAAGTPALVTPVGGLPEIMRPFREDLVCRTSEPAALAETLNQALSNLTTLPDAVECRQYAKRYDWPAVTQAIGDVYRSVIS